MFDSATLSKKLKADNPTYERIRTSDLHALVELLNKGRCSAQQVATEMKKVSGTKWQKYKQTRSYLVKEVPGLAPLVKADLVNFKTKTLTALAGGNIKHDACWESDTGALSDLTHVFVREKVSWGAATPQVKPYIHTDYQKPGQHFGVGNAVSSPGTAGMMSDTHDAKGAYGPAVFNFTGPGTISYKCSQVYQYSDDNKATWKDIPNSTYEITRSVTAIAGGKIKFEISKRSVPPSRTNESKKNSLTA